MRTSLIILLALCSFSFASSQEVFIYSQNGEKHHFQTVDSLIQVQYSEDMNAVKKPVDEEWQHEVYTQGQLLKHSVPAIIDNKFVLNTSGWQLGLYFVRAYYKEKVVFGTLVVNK